METPVCDHCGERENTILYAGSHWNKVLPIAVNLVQCKACGLVYLCPRPGPDEIGQFYQADYPCYQKAVDDEKFWLMRAMRQRKWERRRQMVEKYSAARPGQILDVGSSTGLFLNEMKRAGWQARGVEPNQEAADYARQRFQLDVYTGFLQQAQFPGQSFDVVTYWDVLEHTASPAGELQETERILKENGLLVINIPNWNSLDRHLLGPYWIGLDPPRHFYVFPHHVLNAMLEKAGFEVIDWVCFFPSYFAFVSSIEFWLKIRHPGIEKLVSGLLNVPGMRLVFEPWFATLNFFKRGGVISVFARKKALVK